MVKDGSGTRWDLLYVPESSTAGAYDLVFEAPALHPASRLWSI